MRNSFYILLFCIPALSFGQGSSFDNLITERYIPCADVAQNAPRIINNFHQQQKIDSLFLFLDYYDQKCASRTNNFLLRTKLQLQTRTFNSDVIDSLFLIKLFPIDREIKRSREKKIKPYYYQKSQNTLLYEKVINQIETSTDFGNRSVDEAFLIRFLNEKSITLDDLKTKEYASCKLAALYKAYERKQNNIIEARIGFIFGTIFSQQKIKYINTSPSLGIQLGVRKNKHHLYGIFAFDFGEAPADYFVVDKDSLIATQDWTQGHLGAEYGYEFYRPKFAQFLVYGGIGYNYTSSRYGDIEEDKESVKKGSLNLNTGIGIEKKFITWYLSIQAKYNYANYKYQTPETQVYGSYISLRLIIGANSQPNNYYGYNYARYY